MPDKLVSVQILILIFAVGLFTQCKTQTAENTVKNINSAAVTKTNVAPDEAQIVKKIIDYKIESKELSSLQALPAPEVSFIFPPPSETKMELPENAKSFLNEYWKETLKLQYEFDAAKQSNPAGQPNSAAALYKLAENTRSKLQETKINAPKGERVISTKEAGQIITIFDRTADELIKKAKAL